MDEFISLKTTFRHTMEDGDKVVHLFSVEDGTSANASVASAIANGYPMKRCPLKDLPVGSIATIIAYFQSITTLDDKRKMLVADLTSFPLIATYIDNRDPNAQYANVTDRFPMFIKNTYNNYNPKTEIPLIIVNMDNRFTGIKLVPILTPEELKA